MVASQLHAEREVLWSFHNMKSPALFLLATCVTVAVAAKIPDYVPVCKKSDPNFDQCVIKAIEVVRPHLAKGIPKMKVPPVEPLVIPALEINRNTDALQVKAKLTDIRAFGGSNFIVNNLKTDLNKLAVVASVTLPFLQVTSDYDVDGRLLVIPLKGKGIFKGNFTNIKADVRATGKLIKNKKGTEFAQVKDLSVKLRIGDQTVKFINKGSRDTEAITQTAMNFYNQNRQQVLEIIMPIVEETTVAFARQFGNTIFRAIPFSEILPN
ncbi:circadian clock-controlled protein daywake-like [Macrosteles quadrilineatus]|uniref:circadian clock-controlled protein daywake-like n=1 Tax=Macrosteles quadrilineatus TaxID=74068 RepID=UPI0023E2A328|nr:circadian clock-controlled protein daywake-like [Macrosteles quadrilineatus]